MSPPSPFPPAGPDELVVPFYELIPLLFSLFRERLLPSVSTVASFPLATTTSFPSRGAFFPFSSGFGGAVSFFSDKSPSAAFALGSARELYPFSSPAWLARVL